MTEEKRIFPKGYGPNWYEQEHGATCYAVFSSFDCAIRAVRTGDFSLLRK